MKLRGQLVIRSVAAGLLAIATSYAVSGSTPDFVGAAVNTLVVTITPGRVIAVTIQSLGDAGDLVAFGTALLLAVVFFAISAALGFKASRDGYGGPFGTLMGGLVGGTVSALVAFSLVKESTPALAMGAVVGLYVLVVEWFPSPDRDVDRDDRRRVLTELAGVVAFGGFSYLLGRQVSHKPSPEELTPIFGDRPAKDAEQRKAEVDATLADASEKTLDVGGLPGLVSTTEDFYEVDVDRINPDVRVDTWTLSVTGAVENELKLTFDQLRMGPEEDRFVTLRCVGDALNGHKMDNALWTGIPIQSLLSQAKPTGEYVMLHADDGYYEEFSLEALKRGFLAYGMNGEALPRKHGYPVRALIPGHWGEINVKWLTEIEILEAAATGYWERKGWHGTGPVNTVAKLWTVNHLDDGRIEVGGHAYAGTRGIDAVEVSTDGGSTWQQATLSDPLPGEDVWRQWVHRFEPDRDQMEVVVRAIDGTGAVQSSEVANPFPNGPSGWVRETVSRQ